MLDDDANYPLRVADLKQWAYCPRILYYEMCLPDVRPLTYKMQAGAEAGKSEVGREERRSLRAYGIAAGAREFDVPVRSARLGLRGEIDMVITVEATGEVVPVDYKLSRIPGAHFQMQLMAYGLLLEELRGVEIQRGFLYEIPLRQAIQVRFDQRLRMATLQAIETMRRTMEMERMPPPTKQRAKCVACEFRRFCNDVL